MKKRKKEIQERKTDDATGGKTQTDDDPILLQSPVLRDFSALDLNFANTEKLE